MAGKTPAQQSDATSVVPSNDGVSISPTLFDELHSEAMAEAGLIPYWTEEEKDTAVSNATPLFILGARWAPSEKFGGERAELSITTDVSKLSKTGIWGGHSDTEYWRNMVAKIRDTLDRATDNGFPEPVNIGPVYAHGRAYTNEHGTFTAYTFHGTPQRKGVATTPANSDTTGDDDLPF